MAQSLGLESPQSSARCAICHSPFAAVSQARLAQPEHRDMGVSCESCHGPAEPWLRSHTRADFSHTDRVRSGMRELRDLYGRANACVACHQNVDPAKFFLCNAFFFKLNAYLSLNRSLVARIAEGSGARLHLIEVFGFPVSER